MSDLKTEAVRLDHAIERLVVDAPSPVERAQVKRFEIIHQSRRKQDGLGLAAEGLVGRLFEFTMPRLADPEIMQAGRYLPLLEELVEKVTEQAEGEDRDLRYAALVLRSELRRHQLLRSYVNALIEP